MYIKSLLLLCLLSDVLAVPILISWTNSIRVFDSEDTTNITTITPAIHGAIGVDYHYKRGEIYFTTASGRIYRGWLTSSGTVRDPITIVEVKLSDGLAVDWVNDNLYWTDITKPSVEMSTLDGLYRRTLFGATQGVVKPRAIVVDPLEGIFFWSDWGDNPRIESSGLDGKGKKSIVTSNIFWPNGLALDNVNKKLFILEGLLSSLISCDYDGSTLRIIEKSTDNLQQAFGLTFYNNKMFWTSWKSRALMSMDLAAGNTEVVFRQDGWRGITERLMGVKAVHSSLQKEFTGKSPCEAAGCSHKCLTGRGLKFTCICPFGFTLDSDDKTCVERGYLLVSWRKTIRRYNLQGSEEQPMIDTLTAAISIDYHYKKGLVFWSDVEEHRIYRAPIEQLNDKTAIVTTVETCDGLAVDWVHDVLYWTDTERNTLQAAQLDGSRATVIISEGLDQPRDIALDPLSRFMFWTDWGNNPKIERSDLDGSDRKTIVSVDLAWPNGLTIDYDKQKIYWVDGKLGSISSCSYDGSEKKNLLGAQLVSLQPFSISLLKEHLYWTDWRTQALFKSSKDNFLDLTKIANSTIILLRPNGIKTVHSSRQKEQPNPCISMGCQNLCLGTRSPQIARCMGDHTEPDIDVRMGTEDNNDKFTFTSKAFNDSIVLTLVGPKTPSLVAVSVQCIRRVKKECSEEQCSQNGENNTHVFSDKSQFTINGLVPLAEYIVDFKSTWHNENFTINTTATDPPEVPVIKSVAVRGLNVTIIWSSVDTCDLSPPWYSYRIFKTLGGELVTKGSTNVTEVTIQNIEPEVDFTAYIYTNDPRYNSSISFTTDTVHDKHPLCTREQLLCDGNKDCRNGEDEALDVCAGIKSIIVYKKSKSEVYFRCKVANSTKKALDKFIGTHNVMGSTDKTSFEARAVPCIMWSDSFCFNVTALSKNTQYDFAVSAVVKEGMVGNPVGVSAFTKEGVSGPPENLHVTSYTSTSVVIQWSHPNQSDGILRNFIVNIHQVDSFEEDNCCQSFPMLESPVKSEEPVYSIEMGGFSPASTYAVSITAKTLYVGSSKEIDVNTPPPPMEILRNPNVLVNSLSPLTWNPMEQEIDTESDQLRYHALVKSYLLLLLESRADQHNKIPFDLGPLQSMLESKLGSSFSVLWHKKADDELSFKEPIRVANLTARKQFELAWVQVSQYKDVYGIDHIVSEPFIAV